jgi:hypothetical protein
MWPGEVRARLGSLENALHLIKVGALFFLLFISAALAWTQTGPPSSSQTDPAQIPAAQSDKSAASPEADAEVQRELQVLGSTPLPLEAPGEVRDHQEFKQSDRMFWVVPNFAAVNANTQLPPLTPRGKFVLATEDSVDYTGFTWTAILAGQAMATRSDPELGTGIKGYGRYYWRTFADGVSGTFFTEAIVPTITHEDPRYFTLGHGGFFRRLGYALSRTVVTKTDSGGLTFNWSEVGGNALEAALSNAYYPPQESGWRQTARDWGEQMESAVLNNIAKEFWPDIRHYLLRRD